MFIANFEDTMALEYSVSLNGIMLKIFCGKSEWWWSVDFLIQTSAAR